MEGDSESLAAKIKSLEAELAALKPPTEGKQKSRDYSNTKYVAKTAYGMRDYLPSECTVRNKVIRKITDIFELHGGQAVETPVVELKATLTGKYGEDAEQGETKLIYDLKDQGGEILSLRYDLTVPFARFCAQHNIESIKRYSIAKVYRRDRPNMVKGRYREFYQCDFDIGGIYENMTADAECVSILSQVLSSFDLGFVIKINHRKILDGVFATAGIDASLFRTVCSSVDKLDKVEWDVVKKELLEKGLTDLQSECIWKYAQLNGRGHTGITSLIKALKSDDDLMKHAKSGVDDMDKLFEYALALNVDLEHLEFNLSLARGLDYYTGIIYEAVAEGEGSTGVGSIAGGGRYDNLIGSFRRKNKVIPCVGLSVGIERLFAILQAKSGASRKTDTEVLVCVVGVGKDERERFLKERMAWLAKLWEAGIKSETLWKMNPKSLTQFQQAEDLGIKLALILGPQELANGQVKLRDVASRDEHIVSVDEAIDRIKTMVKN